MDRNGKDASKLLWTRQAVERQSQRQPPADNHRRQVGPGAKLSWTWDWDLACMRPAYFYRRVTKSGLRCVKQPNTRPLTASSALPAALCCRFPGRFASVVCPHGLARLRCAHRARNTAAARLHRRLLPLLEAPRLSAHPSTPTQRAPAPGQKQRVRGRNGSCFSMDFSAKAQRQPLRRLDHRVCIHFVGGAISLPPA